MKTYLEIDEIEKLESVALFLRDRLLIRLSFHVGCRISETLGLEVKDIDLTQGLITIQHLKSRINLACPKCGARLGKSHTFCPKCGSKVEEAMSKEQEHRRMRTLPVDKDTLGMLREYVERRGPVKRGEKVLLFGISRHRAWQIIRDCAQRAGLPKLVNPETGKTHFVSPHRLRDSFAVHAVKLDDSGDGLRLLQEHLGHASFDTTAKYRKAGVVESKTKTVTIQRGNLTEDIVSSGNLALSHTEDLAFQITGWFAVTNAKNTGTTMIAGYVSDVTVEAGDSVKKGQVLAKLDTADWDDHVSQLQDAVISVQRKVTAAERALAQAQLNLETAQYNLYVIQDVKQSKTVAERFPLKKASDDLTDTQTSLKSAEATLQAAQAAGDIATSNAMRELLKSINKEVADKQKTLADFLSGHSPAFTDDVNSKIRQQNTQTELARAKVLDAQIAIDDANETLNKAQKDVDEAKSVQTSVIAPFDGFITQVNVAGGAQISRGKVAMTIADPNQFEAYIMVSERDIPSVKVGAQASVSIDSMPGVSVPAKITYIAPTGTVQQGVVNYQVKVELSSNQPFAQGQKTNTPSVAGQTSPGVVAKPVQLRQGLSVTVNITVQQKNNIVLVPNRAIIRQGKDTVVKVMKDGVVSTRVIKVGINDWQYTEVTDGLSEGEQVVIN